MIFKEIFDRKLIRCAKHNIADEIVKSINVLYPFSRHQNLTAQNWNNRDSYNNPEIVTALSTLSPLSPTLTAATPQPTLP